MKKLSLQNSNTKFPVSYRPYSQEELVQFGPEDSKRSERDSSFQQQQQQQQQQPKLTHPPFPDLDPRHVDSQHPYNQNSLPSSDLKSTAETDENYSDVDDDYETGFLEKQNC
jgi:hypothetical protein